MNILDLKLESLTNYSDSCMVSARGTSTVFTFSQEPVNEVGFMSGKPYDLKVVYVPQQSEWLVIVGLYYTQDSDEIHITYAAGKPCTLIVAAANDDHTYGDAFFYKKLTGMIPQYWRVTPDGVVTEITPGTNSDLTLGALAMMGSQTDVPEKASVTEEDAFPAEVKDDDSPAKAETSPVDVETSPAEAEISPAVELSQNLDAVHESIIAERHAS